MFFWILIICRWSPHCASECMVLTTSLSVLSMLLLVLLVRGCDTIILVVDPSNMANSVAYLRAHYKLDRARGLNAIKINHWVKAVKHFTVKSESFNECRMNSCWLHENTHFNCDMFQQAKAPNIRWLVKDPAVRLWKLILQLLELGK